MNQIQFTIEKESKQYLHLIYLLELIFLILLLKSVALGFVFALIICSLFILKLFPEFGFVFAFTGNILLYVFFDYFKVNITAPVVIMHFLLIFLGIFYFWINGPHGESVVLGKIFWISVIIGIVMIAGLVYSTDRTYGLSKVIFYFIFNISMIFVSLFFKNNFNKIENLLIFAFLIGISLGIISYVVSLKYIYFKFERFSPSTSVNPIFLARSLGISCLSGLVLLKKYKSILPKILLVTAFPILMLPMIWTGSRAPIIGVLLAIFLFYISQPSEPIYRKIIISSAGVFVAALLMLQFGGQIVERLVTPVAQDTSTAFRFLAWLQAIFDFLGSPIFGIGTGSFYLDNPILPLIYPHNLILELSSENGLVGLIFIVVFLYLPIKYSISNIRYFSKTQSERYLQLSIIIFCIYIYVLWNSMFSGDISLNSMVWFSGGLVYAVHISKEKYMEPLEKII
jgi:O-antigen ligase